MRFCPQCGAQTVPQARFCTECGAALSGTQKAADKKDDKTATQAPASPAARHSLFAGLVVLSAYLAIGVGLWVFVLRSQPFPVVAVAEGPASSGGSQALPQDHPPISIPDDAKQQIAALVDEANAKPDSAETWRRLAEVQFRASQLEASYRSAALSSYQHVLELAPDDPAALRGIGNVYYDFEEHTKAIGYYERYLALRPDDANVRTDLGTMYLYTNRADRAIAEYQTVIAANPDFFPGAFQPGHRLPGKGRFYPGPPEPGAGQSPDRRRTHPRPGGSRAGPAERRRPASGSAAHRVSARGRTALPLARYHGLESSPD